MPITKSAKKSLKVSKTKALQNKVWKNKLAQAIKKVDEKNINSTISTIDKVAKVGVISKGKAGRLKSRLSKKFGTPKNEKVAVKPAAKPVAKKEIVKKTASKTSPKAKTKKA